MHKVENESTTKPKTTPAPVGALPTAKAADPNIESTLGDAHVAQPPFTSHSTRAHAAPDEPYEQQRRQKDQQLGEQQQQGSILKPTQSRSGHPPAAASSAGDDASSVQSSLSHRQSSGGGYERLGRLIAHSSVGVSEGADVEAEHKAVKARLKAFEVAFAKENGGRKPRKPSEWGFAWPDYERYAVLHVMRTPPTSPAKRGQKSVRMNSSGVAMGMDGDVLHAVEVTAADLAWAAEQRRLASEAAMIAADTSLQAAEVSRAVAAGEARAAEVAAEEAAKAAEAAAQVAMELAIRAAQDEATKAAEAEAARAAEETARAAMKSAIQSVQDEAAIKAEVEAAALSHDDECDSNASHGASQVASSSGSSLLETGEGAEAMERENKAVAGGVPVRERLLMMATDRENTAYAAQLKFLADNEMSSNESSTEPSAALT